MNTELKALALHSVAFLGNHPPRQCGIATFTADLSDAVEMSSPALRCITVAMNDPGQHYVYPTRVRHQIREENPAAYREAANFLNQSAVDVLSLQHEYGIFGGTEGSHVLTLLRRVRMPVVTTLHTIVESPNPAQRAVMDEICALSERIIVMSTSGAELLRSVHRVASSKVTVIPHGAPTLPDSAQSKAKLGLEGRRVLLTFGLLSPDKGIEYMIDALPAIRERYPDVTYVVLGTTHPHVRAQQGESYRQMLVARGRERGVSEQLLFHDRFATHPELVEFLAAADVYVTPYLNPEQTTSGTLAYAVGAGKAVVSSQFRYSEELLAGGRGRLVKPRDSAALAKEIGVLLGDGAAKADQERRAQEFGQQMLWPVIAEAYLSSFSTAIASYRDRAARVPAETATGPRLRTLPELNLAHLRAMTDDTGLLQHAIHTIPRREDGYCLDDNARALTLTARIESERIGASEHVRSLSTGYLAFVRHAFEPKNGRFRNLLSFTRRWTEPFGSEDSHGRALWALGTVCAHSSDLGHRAVAEELFERALPAARAFTSPRAWSFSLLGVAEYVKGRGNDSAIASLGRELAECLHTQFLGCATKDWPWCEDRLTYSNARMPEALLRSSLWLGNERMKATGLRALEWLGNLQTTPTGLFAPIGSNEFYVRGGVKCGFDQQPIEACGMIAGSLIAYELTDDTRWSRRATEAFDWFLGRNQLNQWVYDPNNGGCRDGLHFERLNENQGAESTLSFLMALLDMRQFCAATDSQEKVVATSHRQLAAEAVS